MFEGVCVWRLELLSAEQNFIPCGTENSGVELLALGANKMKYSLREKTLY